MIKMNISKHTKIKGLSVLFLITIIPLIFGLLPSSFENFSDSMETRQTKDDPNLKLSLPPTTHDWWNKSWSFRVPVSIEAVGGQQEAPVELFINFTKYFTDLDIQDPELNTSSIRVIEYLSSSIYYEVDPIQFDPYSRSYNSQTNAIGDLIWILNGTTLNGQIRDFFIYFNNGTYFDIPEPNYDIIRIWHEGFEEYQSGDILRPTDGQDNYHPTFWEISNTTSARGSSSMRIWGNCWKASATGSIAVNADTRVTAKMRFDDPSIQREISGLGFDTTVNNIPTSTNSYNIRGSQAWGSAGSYKFRNQYYVATTFFWYTFIPSEEFSLNPFTYIVYVADDDSWSSLDLYWDDISIWNKPIQTTPNNSLQTTLGDIQPIAYTLRVVCKDGDGNPVPNAHIYLTNDLFPLYNQDHETDENGEWTFEDMEIDAFYNITANYTQNGLSNPKTATVYSRENYQITQLNNRITAHLFLTKFNFDIKDKDDYPIQYGFVLLKEGTDTVGKTVLSDTGIGSITWVNTSSYDYEVYYDYDSLPDNSNYRYPNLLIYSEAAAPDIDISTEITKIIFNVTDNTPEQLPFTNAKLRFYNSSDFDNEIEIIANVSVDINGLAQYISFSNDYLNWGNYTVDIYFGGSEQNFIANGTPINSFDGFEFLLKHQDYTKIEINLNKDDWNSTIAIIDYITSFDWDESGMINFNFTKQAPGDLTPIRVTPDELTIQIFDAELSPYNGVVEILSYETSTGIFMYTFNTADLHLIGGSTYYFKIIGNYKSYVFNDIGFKQFSVQSIPTDIKYYDYSLTELTDKRFSVVYSESVNVTVDFFNNKTVSSLNGAYITYTWDYGTGILADDPLHSNLYYFEFDSSTTPNDAEYIIDIRATLTNFSTIDDSIIVSILPRPTSINGTTTLFQKSPNIYVFASRNFLFEYKDTLRNISLGNLDVASYNWYRLDEDGNPLSGPGNEGSGALTSTIGDLYILDFDTELREVGEYSIFITLQKNNYEVRNAFISLSINKRPISLGLSATGLSGNRINIVQGASVHFTAVLTDPTNGSQLLNGANVTLQINGNEYSLDPVPGSPGTYEYIFSTSHINTFIAPQTLTGQILIELDNYEIDPTPITIVVGMTEIFPGFPLFYFLLIVGGIVAVAGSLVGYRLIQRARIPTFVKKARQMKSVIKSKKTISDSLLYPSKEEFIAKKLGDKWDQLDLSLDDILNLEEKKKKRLSEIKPGEE